MAAPVEETPEGSCGVYSSSSDASVGDVVWEEKVRSLKDIIASFRLPLVARVKSGDLSRLLPRSGADDNNIIQIHELRRRKIVFARRLQWEKRQHDYIVSGEQVEVPASFKGKSKFECPLVLHSVRSGVCELDYEYVREREVKQYR